MSTTRLGNTQASFKMQKVIFKSLLEYKHACLRRTHMQACWAAEQLLHWMADELIQ